MGQSVLCNFNVRVNFLSVGGCILYGSVYIICYITTREYLCIGDLQAIFNFRCSQLHQRRPMNS